MKKSIFAVSIAAIFFTPQVFAQAKNFEGFSGGVNLNIASTTTDASTSGVTLSGSDSDNNTAVQVQYTAALNDKYTVSFGATVGLSPLKAGKISTISFKAKDTNSLFVAPGYAMTNSTLLYGKLSAVSATGEASTSAGSDSTSLSGVGYGAGIQTLLTKNVYLQAEYAQTNYAEKTFSGVSFKPKTSQFTIGVGYKF